MDITPKQKTGIQLMINTYGQPDKLLISYGWDNTVRMDWCNDKRHLFIDEDGNRIAWNELVI